MRIPVAPDAATVVRIGRWRPEVEPVEPLAEGLRRRHPPLRVLGQQIGNQPVERRRRVRGAAGQARGSLIEVGQRGGHVGGADKGRRAGDHLEQDDPERVQVGTGVRLLAADLLGAQILGCSEDDARSGQVAAQAAARLGDPKVGHLHPQSAPLVVGEQDVGRLDVPVHQTSLMGVHQHVGDLSGDGHRQPGWKSPLFVEQLAQRGAAHQLHDDVGGASVHAGVERRDHSGMGKAGGGDCLAPEALQEDTVLGQVGLQQLDGHGTAQDLIVALPDVGHPAASDRHHQPVAPTQYAAGLEGGGRSRTPTVLHAIARYLRRPGHEPGLKPAIRQPGPSNTASGGGDPGHTDGPRAGVTPDDGADLSQQHFLGRV